MSNKEGKFGRLTGTDIANILAFVAVSGSNKMVNIGDCFVLLRFRFC